MPPFKIAFIVADQREVLGQHQLPEPYFGPAPKALLAGLKQTPGVEVHIILRASARARARPAG